MIHCGCLLYNRHRAVFICSRVIDAKMILIMIAFLTFHFIKRAVLRSRLNQITNRAYAFAYRPERALFNVRDTVLFGESPYKARPAFIYSIKCCMVMTSACIYRCRYEHSLYLHFGENSPSPYAIGACLRIKIVNITAHDRNGIQWPMLIYEKMPSFRFIAWW